MLPIPGLTPALPLCSAPYPSSASSLRLHGGTEVDRVEYDGSTNWPDPTGAALFFTGLASDDNATASNWTTTAVREDHFRSNKGSDARSLGIRGSDQPIGGTLSLPVEMAGLTARAGDRDALVR